MTQSSQFRDRAIVRLFWDGYVLLCGWILFSWPWPPMPRIRLYGSGPSAASSAHGDPLRFRNRLVGRDAIRTPVLVEFFLVG